MGASLTKRNGIVAGSTRGHRGAAGGGGSARAVAGAGRRHAAHRLARRQMRKEPHEGDLFRTRVDWETTVDDG